MAAIRWLRHESCSDADDYGDDYNGGGNGYGEYYYALSIAIIPVGSRDLVTRVGKTWVDLEVGCSLILIVLDRLDDHDDCGHVRKKHSQKEKSIKNAAQRRWPQVRRTLHSNVMAKNFFTKHRHRQNVTSHHFFDYYNFHH